MHKYAASRDKRSKLTAPATLLLRLQRKQETTRWKSGRISGYRATKERRYAPEERKTTPETTQKVKFREKERQKRKQKCKKE